MKVCALHFESQNGQEVATVTESRAVFNVTQNNFNKMLRMFPVALVSNLDT